MMSPGCAQLLSSVGFPGVGCWVWGVAVFGDDGCFGAR
jgi:hypothetical protein